MADKRKDHHSKDKNAPTSSTAAVALSQAGANAEQLLQTMQAASLAAAGGMGAFGFSPFYPYGSMYPFGGVGMPSANSGFWPGVATPDYLMNLAALQSLASTSTPTTESFADILSKMPQAPGTESVLPKSGELTNSFTSAAFAVPELNFTSTPTSAGHLNKSVSGKTLHSKERVDRALNSSSAGDIQDNRSAGKLLADLAGFDRQASLQATNASRAKTAQQSSVSKPSRERLLNGSATADSAAVAAALLSGQNARKSSNASSHHDSSSKSSANRNVSGATAKSAANDNLSDSRSNLSSPLRATPKPSSTSTANHASAFSANPLGGAATPSGGMSSVFPADLNAAALSALANMSSTADNVKFDLNSLNASAMAWAALAANPFLLSSAGFGGLPFFNPGSLLSPTSAADFAGFPFGASSTPTTSGSNLTQSSAKSSSRPSDQAASKGVPANSTSRVSSTSSKASSAQRPSVPLVDNGIVRGSANSAFSALGSSTRSAAANQESDFAMRDPKDNVDATIDNVIRQHQKAEQRSLRGRANLQQPQDPLLLKQQRQQQQTSAAQSTPAPALGPIAVPMVRGGGGRGRGRGRGGVTTALSATVRDQLAMKRQVGDSSASSVCSGSAFSPTPGSQMEALDLSKKPTPINSIANGHLMAKDDAKDSFMNESGQSLVGLKNASLSSFKRSHSPDVSNSSSPIPKKRRVADESLCKLPLLVGWRRQTCIRSISASGVRGDVIYFSPCGKRLSTYAEVQRYLTKSNVRDINREHFSFSSRVIVGEFIQMMQDNGLVTLTEEEVRRTIESLQNGAFGSSGATDRDSSSGRQSTSPDEEDDLEDLLDEEGSGSSLEDGVEENDSTQGRLRRRGRKPNVEQELAEQMRLQAEKDAELNAVASTLHGVSTRTGKPSRGRVSSSWNSKSSALNQRQAAWWAKRLERERQTQILLDERRKRVEEIRSQKSGEAMKRAREKEVQRQQLAALKRQEEDYIRQMMAIVDLEREKQRQEVLMQRIAEARRKQEEKQRLYAEKLIRREEKLAAKNAQIVRMKQLRQPLEDMELDDAKVLPSLSRIEGLRLPGRAFADLLMAMEFLNNFAHVLKLDKNEFPSLDSVQRGLLNEKRYVPSLIDLVKLLLTLVMEYPGLPAGKEGRTFLNQVSRDLNATEENLSELLRMFLCSRDAEGKKLGKQLEANTFEALSATTKAAILAYMCNELLYCRNVVREIESNIEESAKLKSERWNAESKLRQLKMTQSSKKRVAAIANAVKEDVKEEQMSDAAAAEAASASATPAPVVATHNKKHRGSDASEAGADNSDSESVSIKASEQGCDAGPVLSITNSTEDEKLSLDEIDLKVQKLTNEVSALRSSLLEKSSRVRSLSYGQDRFCRTYWMLPSIGSILVEGLESGGPNSHWVSDSNLAQVDLSGKRQAEANPTDDADAAERTLEIRDCLEAMLDVVAQSVDGASAEEEDETKLSASFFSDQLLSPPQSSSKLEDSSVKQEVEQDGAMDLSSFSRSSFKQEPMDVDDVKPSPFDDLSSLMSDTSDNNSKLLLLTPPPDCKLSSFKFEPDDCGSPSTSHAIASVAGTSFHHRNHVWHKSPRFGFHPTKHAKRRKPIPKEFHYGWWQISDEDELNAVQGALHCRGIRERNLNRVISKYKESIWNEKPLSSCKPLAFSHSSNDNAIEIQFGAPLPDVPNRILTEVNLDVIRRCFREIVTMEQKVFHANIHFRNWKPFDAEIDFDDSADCCLISALSDDLDESVDTEANDASATCAAPKRIVWNQLQFQELLDLGKERLAQLELNIERRYLNPPFHENNKVPIIPEERASTPATDQPASMEDSNQSGSQAAAKKSENGVDNNEETDEEFEEQEVPVELERWRTGVLLAKNASQLKMCIEQLDSNIAWEKSIMKASCQICQSGENDSQLLLCDGCDLAFHTYCFKPQMSNIPSGDWFCPLCIAKASEKPCCLLCRKLDGKLITCGLCSRSFHSECLVRPPARIKNGTVWFCARCAKENKAILSLPTPSTAEAPELPPPNKKGRKKGQVSAKKAEKLAAAAAMAPKERKKPGRKPKKSQCGTPINNATVNGMSTSANNGTNASANCSTVFTPSNATLELSSSSAVSSSPLKWQEICSIMHAQLDVHKEAWPFKLPVDSKLFPTYKKVIKKPMDLSTIEIKLKSQKYENEVQYAADVQLIFDNCKRFNEDDSDVSKSGKVLAKFFKKRWKELKKSLVASSFSSLQRSSNVNTPSTTRPASEAGKSEQSSLNNSDIFDFL